MFTSPPDFLNKLFEDQVAVLDADDKLLVNESILHAVILEVVMEVALIGLLNFIKLSTFTTG